jgi:hypothetical protein
MTLQSGDAACLAAWERICEASRREFEAIYTRLGVSVSERGESFYNPMLAGERSAARRAAVCHGLGGAELNRAGCLRKRLGKAHPFFCCLVVEYRQQLTLAWHRLLPAVPGVVAELKEKGVAEVSDGATCVFVEGSEVPLIVQKTDGERGSCCHGKRARVQLTLASTSCLQRAV